jgi:hypothetical protein
MNFSHLNVGGWTHSNHELRQALILYSQADIVSVCEKHLSSDLDFDLNCMWYGFNRTQAHRNVPKASGGGGFNY